MHTEMGRVVDEARRVMRFVGSTGAVDRDGEVVDQDGWMLDNYLKNPQVLFAHQHDELPVARAESVEVTDKGLIFDVRFPTEVEAGASFAKSDSIYRLAKSGFLNTTSVSFYPVEPPKAIKGGDGRTTPRRIWPKNDLLELSLVPIPSNPEALATGFADGVLKSLDREFLNELVVEATEDLENVDWAEAVTKAIDAQIKPAPADIDFEEDDEPVGGTGPFWAALRAELELIRETQMAQMKLLKSVKRDLGIVRMHDLNREAVQMAVREASTDEGLQEIVERAIAAGRW
jgi:HK97 family phage prohead protease